MNLRRWCAFALLISAPLLPAFQGVLRAEDAVKPLSVSEAKKLRNPIPYTKKSIAQGRSMFVRNCAGCHGNDGKATVDVVADATDLTSPKLWKNGTSDGEIFRSIRDGQSASMPAFQPQIHPEEDLWYLVNFIHSLWSESMRPPLQEKPADEPPGSKSK